MPTHAPAYFPGSPPGVDPFFDLEAAVAREIAKRVLGYPLGYFGDTWIGETRPEPQAMADAIKDEQSRHAEGCPKREAFVLGCTCGRSP